MKTYKIGNLDVTLAENWNEINLKQFVRFTDWLESRPSKFEFKYQESLSTYELIRVFAYEDIPNNQYEQLEMKDLANVVSELRALVDSVPTFEKKDSLTIKDKLYAFINMDDITAGELISFEIISETKKGNSVLPYLLGIICRPATIVFNEEKQKDEYKLEKFNSSDIEWRAKFMETVPAFEVMAAVSFFLGGNKQLQKTIQTFMKRQEGQPV